MIKSLLAPSHRGWLPTVVVSLCSMTKGQRDFKATPMSVKAIRIPKSSVGLRQNRREGRKAARAVNSRKTENGTEVMLLFLFLFLLLVRPIARHISLNCFRDQCRQGLTIEPEPTYWRKYLRRLPQNNPFYRAGRQVEEDVQLRFF